MGMYRLPLNRLEGQHVGAKVVGEVVFMCGFLGSAISGPRAIESGLGCVYMYNTYARVVRGDYS